MGQVIHVDFRKGRFTLRQARDFLGNGWFRKALMEWSIEELTRTANCGEAWLTDAGDAYTAVLNFRLSRQAPGTARLYHFPERKKAA